MKKHDHAKLEKLFREVARLTSRHRVFGDSAVVYPSDLGKALEKVDPDWWKTVNPVIDERK